MKNVHRLPTSRIPKERATESLYHWLLSNYPDAAQRIVAEITPSDLGATDTVATTADMDKTPWYEKFLDAATKIVPVYVQGKTQMELVKAQIDRAKQGQPPLDLTKYSAPPVVVQHEFAPNAISNQISPQTKTLLFIGAGLLAALIILPPLLRR